MDWLRCGIGSISGFLSHQALPAAPDPVAQGVQRVRAIQEAMLDALGDDGVAHDSRLALRISRALQVQPLWDLRGDLMNAAALRYGEARARRLMATVDSAFAGSVPQPWMAARRARAAWHWMQR